MHPKYKQPCDRCAGPMLGRATLSSFNRENICMDCRKMEERHPDYYKAVDADIQAACDENYNFTGIGLPKDLAEEAETRKHKNLYNTN